jgi:hypothetical protein
VLERAPLVAEVVQKGLGPSEITTGTYRGRRRS